MAAPRLSVSKLLRPHWPLLGVSAAAMLIQGFANLVEPWPLKVIFDYVLGSEAVPKWLVPWIGERPLDVLDVAAASVVVIAAMATPT